MNGQNNESFLEHYGMPKRSGRYPYGSGENPYQHGADFAGRVQELRKEGMSDVDIAKAVGLKSTTELRAQYSSSIAERRAYEVARARSLKSDGYNPSEIGRIMGKNESSVRSLLNQETETRMSVAKRTVNFLKKQVEELTHANEILTYENQGLRSKMGSTDNMPILYLGEEEEFFQDEIKAMLLDALEQALPNYASGTRRRAVLEDIIKSNNCKRRANDRSEQLKNSLRGYKTMSGSMKRTLQDMGFVITEEGKHYKFIYYGDGRYMATLAKTPSDNRSGMNIALEIIKDMF